MKPIFYFVLPILLGACSRASPAKTELNLPEPAAPLSLPAFTDPNDLRTGWIRDLTQPRLSRLSALTWTCADNNSVIEIDLSGLGATCDEFLKTNFIFNPPVPPANQRPGCRGDALLRIPLPAAAQKCDPGTRPALLSQLRLPSGTGLYVRDGAILRPRFANLPALEEAPSGNPRLRTPDRATWLAASAYRGAAWLALEATAPHFAPGDLLAVHEFLTKAKAPRAFRPSPQLFANSSANAPSPKTPWVRVTHGYREALFRNTCEYVRQWISARQLLAPAGRVNESTVFEMRCLIGWAEDPIPEDSIVLAWLPVPLALDETFPFKTVEDALSPSLFQSLKIAR